MAPAGASNEDPGPSGVISCLRVPDAHTGAGVSIEGVLAVPTLTVSDPSTSPTGTVGFPVSPEEGPDSLVFSKGTKRGNLGELPTVEEVRGLLGLDFRGGPGDVQGWEEETEGARPPPLDNPQKYWEKCATACYFISYVKNGVRTEKGVRMFCGSWRCSVCVPYLQKKLYDDIVKEVTSYLSKAGNVTNVPNMAKMELTFRGGPWGISREEAEGKLYGAWTKLAKRIRARLLGNFCQKEFGASVWKVKKEPGGGDRIRDRLRERHGMESSFEYVTVVEWTKKGMPHTHSIVKMIGFLPQAWLSDQAEKCGFGKVAWIRKLHGDDPESIENACKYVADIRKASQIPQDYPKNFRRVRSSRKFFETREEEPKDLQYHGFARMDLSTVIRDFKVPRDRVRVGGIFGILTAKSFEQPLDVVPQLEALGWLVTDWKERPG
jgi:hypothetical protein